MFCVNLCELLQGERCADLPRFLAQVAAGQGERVIGRVSLGSSFCSQYFLRFTGYQEVFDWCRTTGTPVTVTVPVLSQKDLEAGKARLEQLCALGRDLVDEITVNDVGMLSWLRDRTDCRLNLGRLFFRDPRDARVPDYTGKPVTPAFVTQLAEGALAGAYSGIELDPTNREIDLTPLAGSGCCVGLHQPLCYLTTGNICKFASVFYPMEQKFRPNLRCGMECSHIVDATNQPVPQTGAKPELLRLGRTLYFAAEEVTVTGVELQRILYFPVQEWRKASHEGI